jgi:hypothetical protein
VAAAVASGAEAQEPTPTRGPSLLEIRLSEQEPGAYKLEVFNAAAEYGAADITVTVHAIGTDQAVVMPLRSDGVVSNDISMVLDRPLPGMSADVPGCYNVTFFVQPHDQSKPPSEDRGPSLATRACVKAGSELWFPAYDSVVEPPPAPPSEVRLVPHPCGDTWAITWRDNSANELAFEPGVVLLDKPFDQGGARVGSIELPEVPADSTAINCVGWLFTPDEPVEPACGYAMVLVFAVGADAVSFPGSTTVPACFGASFGISFPEAGAATVASHDSILATASVLIGGGALLVFFGALRLRRRRAVIPARGATSSSIAS